MSHISASAHLIAIPPRPPHAVRVIGIAPRPTHRAITRTPNGDVLVEQDLADGRACLLLTRAEAHDFALLASRMVATGVQIVSRYGHELTLSPTPDGELLIEEALIDGDVCLVLTAAELRRAAPSADYRPFVPRQAPAARAA